MRSSDNTRVGDDDGHRHAESCDHGTRRRRVLGAGAAGVAASLTGCLGSLTGDGTEAPPADAIAEDADCDVCGMIVAKHPGPNGQLFYDEESPDGHDNPARFDALKQCFFPYKLEHDAMGWSETAAYVTDYSAVDYDVSAESGATTISSHVAASAFAPAADLQYVVGSEVQGAMGPDFVPFSDGDDAAAFADEYGGDVVAFDDIGEGLVGR
jgi:nitrous oxide reductase accessory protein NosL